MPHWYIIQCTSGKEKAAERRLDALGYPDAWHPQKQVNTRPRGRLARLRAKYQGRSAFKPWVPGYVFIPAAGVEPHRINGSHGSIWMRLLSPAGKPYRLTDQDMARMKDMPERVRELVEEAERLEREAQEAVRPQVGYKATVVQGPLEGLTGYVVDRRGDEYAIDLPIGRVRLDVIFLEKVNA